MLQYFVKNIGMNAALFSFSDSILSQDYLVKIYITIYYNDQEGDFDPIVGGGCRCWCSILLGA